jgi:hypothetical protein
MVGQIKEREMRCKRYKAPSHVLDRRPFADRDGSASSVGDKRDDLLPTRYVSATVPYVIRRPCPLAWDGLGMVSGRVVFPGLSKLLNQEDALGVPCLDTVIVALRRRALAGRRKAADRRHPSLRCHLTVCYTGHQAGKR